MHRKSGCSEGTQVDRADGVLENVIIKKVARILDISYLRSDFKRYTAVYKYNINKLIIQARITPVISENQAFCSFGEAHSVPCPILLEIERLF